MIFNLKTGLNQVQREKILLTAVYAMFTLLTAGKADLKRHSGNKKKHIGNSKAIQGQNSFTTLLVDKLMIMSKKVN